jgi:hypothetical protein
VPVNEERSESSYPSNLPMVQSGLSDWLEHGIDKKPRSYEQGSEESLLAEDFGPVLRAQLAPGEPGQTN